MQSWIKIMELLVACSDAHEAQYHDHIVIHGVQWTCSCIACRSVETQQKKNLQEGRLSATSFLAKEVGQKKHENLNATG